MLELIEPFTVYFIAAVIVLLAWNIWLEWRMRALTRGSKGESLEKHVTKILKDYEQFGELKKHIDTIDERLSGSIRGIGVVRFNPFKGSGSSKQSFAAAFLNEHGSGLVISTIHARESLSIFSKEIANFKSEQELTQEESAALEKARDSMHNGSA